MTKQQILVPTDFQPASLAALAFAQRLAKPLGAEITLLHVFSVPIAVYPGFTPIFVPGAPEQLANSAKQALDDLAKERGVENTELRCGDPTEEILESQKLRRPLMIVMGTHGRKRLPHFFLGSVAERVVRASACPVLVAHAPSDQREPEDVASKASPIEATRNPAT